MIIEEIKHIKESERDLRKFGYTVGTVLLIITIFLFFKGRDSYRYFGTISILLIVCAIIFPIILRTLNKLWMIISILLGWLMTRVILLILFYLVLTPISLLTKIFKKDFLDLKFDDSGNSYWVKREKKILNTSDYEKQF